MLLKSGVSNLDHHMPPKTSMHDLPCLCVGSVCFVWFVHLYISVCVALCPEQGEILFTYKTKKLQQGGKAYIQDLTLLQTSCQDHHECEQHLQGLQVQGSVVCYQMST